MRPGPSVPEYPLQSFVHKVQSEQDEKRFPWNGGIELTARCNLSCIHCYINLPVSSRRPLQEEFTTGDWLRILDEMAAEGCLWLLITGGEPVLRPDFFAIYEHAKRKGFIINLFTNGTMITDRTASRLAEWPPHCLELTLYGRTKRTYEAITRVKGSYESCLRGIDLIMSHNLPLKLKTMVMTTNVHELDEMRDFAKQLGLKFYFDGVLHGRLDSSTDPTKLRIPPEGMIAAESLDSELAKRWRSYLAGRQSVPDGGHLYQCGAARTSFHVDSFGLLHPCILVRNMGYDLRAVSFRKGWMKLAGLLELKRSRESPCVQCDFAVFCSQCPGLAQLESGDPEQYIPHLCTAARLRADMFDSRQTLEEGSNE